MEIIPNDPNVSALSLVASKDVCILGLAESEYLSCHQDAEADGQQLVTEIVPIASQYLQGITIHDHYTKKGRLLRREYFLGTDPEQDQKRLGSSMYGFSGLFRRSHRVQQRTYRFIR